MTEDNMPPLPMFRHGLLGYIDAIRFKLSLQKQIKEYEKKISGLVIEKHKKELVIEEIKSYNQNLIAQIQYLNDPSKSLTVNLIAREIKQPWYKKPFSSIFKFDGYIGFFNLAKEFKIYKVNNFKLFWEINQESYGLIEKVGLYQGKPIYIVVYPHCLSLKPEGDKLSYDAKSLYNYINYVTKANISQWGGGGSLVDFIKKNFILILVLVGLGLLFFTPQGKQILSQIIPPPSKSVPG